MTMSVNKDSKLASKTIKDTSSSASQEIVNVDNNSVGSLARRAEHMCLTTFSSYAENKNSLGR